MLREWQQNTRNDFDPYLLSGRFVRSLDLDARCSEGLQFLKPSRVGGRLHGDLIRFWLHPMQVVDGFLSVSGRLEDEPLLISQSFEPMRDISSVLFTRFR